MNAKNDTFLLPSAGKWPFFAMLIVYGKQGQICGPLIVTSSAHVPKIFVKLSVPFTFPNFGKLFVPFTFLGFGKAFVYTLG